MGEINEHGEITHQIVETESEQNVTIIDSPLSSDISYLCKSLDINPKIVYFPGSGVLKLGPIFSAETKVIYFDDNEKAMKELQLENNDAYIGDPEKILPADAENADLLILKNYSANKPLDSLKLGGHILTTDAEEASNILINHPGFALISVMENQSPNDSLNLNSDVQKVDDVKRELTLSEEEQTQRRQQFRQRLIAGIIPDKQDTKISSYIFRKLE